MYACIGVDPVKQRMKVFSWEFHNLYFAGDLSAGLESRFLCWNDLHPSEPQGPLCLSGEMLGGLLTIWGLPRVSEKSTFKLLGMKLTLFCKRDSTLPNFESIRASIFSIGA